MKMRSLLLMQWHCLLLMTAACLGASSSIAAAAAFATPAKKKNAALNDVVVKQKSVAGLTKLRFQASTNYVTKPVAKSNDLVDFFCRTEHRDMILAGTINNPVELVKAPDTSLYNTWQMEAAKESSFVRPVAGEDPILRVTTTGIQFPGLALKLVATVGCKQVLLKDENNPEFQITLLSNELQAEGPAPLVWVFEQLTGTGSKGGGSRRNNAFPPPPPFFGGRSQNTGRSSSKFTTHSTNTISAETVNTTDGDELVAFKSVARLLIDVSFPSILLNILPVSKEMAERQGSNAIRRVVERDIGPSLEALRSRYVDFVEAN